MRKYIIGIVSLFFIVYVYAEDRKFNYETGKGDIVNNLASEISFLDISGYFEDASASPPTVQRTINELAASRENVTTTVGWTDDGSIVRLTTASDNVGIGRSNPSAKLHIFGAGTGTGFAFRVADTTPTDRLVIQDDGNVGIGTTSPKTLLQVSGTSPQNNTLVVNSAGGVGIGNTSPVGLFQISGTSPQNNTLTVLAGSGNVGIGTTTPARRLQVVGDYARIGDGGTINFADGDGDLYIEDELEVDGVARFSNLVYFASDATFDSTGDIGVWSPNAYMYFADAAGSVKSYFQYVDFSSAPEYTSFAFTAAGINQGTGQFIFTDTSGATQNYNHPASNNPILYIQSAWATGRENKYISFSHNQTDANIQTGSGRLNLTSGSTAATDLLYIRSAGTGTNMALRIANTTPTDILAVLDSQRVGIGTTLPTTPLTIIASNTAPANNLYLSGTAGARLIISQPDGGCSSCGVDTAGTTWACIDVTCP